MDVSVRLREEQASSGEQIRLTPRRGNQPAARQTSNAIAVGSVSSDLAAAPAEASSLGQGLKRAFDIVASASLLILLSPLMAIIWLMVVSTSRGPALFTSPRVGRFGRIFMMPKFRSMVIGSPTCARETLASSAQRLTPVGDLLRRTGLDELPQLWCVLRGDMSLIGPRPLLADDPGSEERAKFPVALEVRPGISGLAQVSGRNLVSPRRKARLDAFYARTASLGFDLVLLARTVAVIVSGKGFL